jgi:hypothetical protein
MSIRLLPVTAGILLLVSVASADTPVKCSIQTLGACPKNGCTKPNSATAVTNGMKRTTAISGSPVEISFDQIKLLQKAVDNEFPATVQGVTIKTPRGMTAAPRKKLLSGLRIDGKQFSEGDFVELAGFIASEKQAPHPNKKETVNCNLTGEPNNDYHINITPTKNSDESKGVVVEMIPQNPNRKSKDWNLTKLLAIQDKQFQVKIQGRLFYDNEHVPNPDVTHGTNPLRISVWEIHPLASFLVCTSGSCTKHGAAERSAIAFNL